MSVLQLDAVVNLNGVNIVPYIMNLKRNHRLCDIVQTFSIQCDKNLLDFLATQGIELQPSNTVEIYETGVKKLTGHVRSVQRSRAPDYNILIEGTDLYKFAKDYFLDNDTLGVSNGETVSYWIGRLLGLINLPYTFDSSETAGRTVAPQIEFKLRTIDDCITEVLSYASAYIYMDANGVAHIQKGSIASDTVLSGGRNGNVFTASHEVSDNNTRNVAKVWGYKGNVILRPGESPFIQSVNASDLVLPVNKTVVYASNLIQTQTEADRLSEEIIAALGQFDSVKNLDVVNPSSLFIGTRSAVSVDLETAILSGNFNITGISSEMSPAGYTARVTLDEFCPKFAGWELSGQTYPLYAGTRKHGIYRSVDNGATWTAFNTGLPVGDKYVKKMAFTYLDDGMAIVNGIPYYSDGYKWTRCVLPTPVNGAGDNPAPLSSTPVSVDSLAPGIFNLLTVSTLGHATSVSGVLLNRTWLYTTLASGGTNLNDWSCQPVHNVDDYNFYGIDVNSKNGFPYIIANKFSDPNFYLSNIRLDIGGSVRIARGRTINGGRVVISDAWPIEEERGILPKSVRSAETTRILRIWQNSETYRTTGLIDGTLDDFNIDIRLVLGSKYPGSPPWKIPNIYFSPFVGWVYGHAGYHDFDCGGALYTGQYITSTDIFRGYKDVTVYVNKTNFYYSSAYGLSFCFYVGHNSLINGQESSEIYFNGESLLFDHYGYHETPDLELPEHFQWLWAGFYDYPFDLTNLSVSLAV